MASDEDKPLHKQFLRVQREDEEDTWISGEELKTEGSSGSDDEAPRRKVTNRKSRRRRSEGYTPPEARLSLPNISDNKAGIAFRVSKPEEKDLKGERFSLGGDLSVEEERLRLEACMSRMSTRSSLDRTEEADGYSKNDNEWRPKRGSLKLPNLEEDNKRKKVIRFNEKVEKIGDSIRPRLVERLKGFNLNLNSEVEKEDLVTGYEDIMTENSGFSDSTEEDIDKYIMKSPNVGNLRPILKNKLTLPNFEGINVESSVKEFVLDMNKFYDQMSSKLKSLKNCPVLGHLQSPKVDVEENYLQTENFKKLYKNLKKTPEVKKTLNFINKMDSDIFDTITKFREERAERLRVQKEFLIEVPKDHNSQLFLQLCEFESRSNDIKMDSKEERNLTNEIKKNTRCRMKNQNFIERNIELAKIGMNLSLSDEQKQRLEKILLEEVADVCDHGDSRASVKNDNQQPSGGEECENNFYSTCTVNAYSLRNDHEKRLKEIDSALKALEEDNLKPEDENIGVRPTRSLKELDEKLKALSDSYLHEKQVLENDKKNISETDATRIVDLVAQILGKKKTTELKITDLSDG